MIQEEQARVDKIVRQESEQSNERMEYASSQMTSEEISRFRDGQARSDALYNREFEQEREQVEEAQTASQGNRGTYQSKSGRAMGIRS